MKKLFALGIAAFLLLLVSCPDSEASKSGSDNEPMTDKTAYEYFQDINLGINTGNTLDAHKNGVSGETLWSNRKISQKLFDGFKKSGLDIVRVPVTWIGHIGPAPDYKLDTVLLERVAEVVGYAKNANIKIIINIQHDGDSMYNSNAACWLLIRKILQGQNKEEQDAIKAGITDEFVKVWAQIAERFKDYGDYLIFEPFNELHDGRWGLDPAKELYDIINEWNQAFVDTVRASGGKNARRFLLVVPYNTSIVALNTDKFVMPKDSEPNRLIVSFHYYRPNNFVLYGMVTDWDTPENRGEITDYFSNLKNKYTDNKIPVLMGENGPVLSALKDDDRVTADANSIKYIEFLYGEAKKNGIIPLYWDNGVFDRKADNYGRSESFGLFNRQTGEPSYYEDHFTKVLKAMVDVFK